MRIYEHIKTFSTLKNAIVLLGSDYFQSVAGNKLQPDINQLVIIADFNASVIRNRNVIEKITYSGVLMYGRKFEDSTFSSLKENFEDKLNARLEELSELALKYNNEFACLFGYTITSERLLMQLNRFASNIDFVACEITLDYD